ncbi:MAG: hypothetical protein HY736_10200 [Verrucomicrobia bacterium]|nr:hypothetical protein [Verrucomicrobiota bacterium]
MRSRLWLAAFLPLFAVSVAAAEEVVFAVRQPKGPHWYENFGHAVTDVNRTAYGAGGRLCKLDLQTGQVTVLVGDPAGAVRDPQVHYDGRKILFSYRQGGSPYFRLYEINADGTDLRQLTGDPFDDLEPSYLPDGGIVFCSSRCNRFVPCWYVQVATLHRCDADGKNIRPLYNLSRPEKSLQLLAPLARSAGGHALCGDVFTSPDDPDYRALLAGVEETKAYLESITRFTMPNFRPEPEYVREMKRYGILPENHRDGGPIDVYDTDRRYSTTTVASSTIKVYL